ncbi:hypothetical protein E2562_022021 [Oryza meyeriana var. granulata]|uniref:Uncharacterized protein n=1 Tax=Oryza meyeriana var. granulata TaxID=110450 RepID=A0A6G1ENI1_9ORYZ|nr:hypothetical protein E2562_022021 [Oryza meyeriana var. granulata]
MSATALRPVTATVPTSACPVTRVTTPPAALVSSLATTLGAIPAEITQAILIYLFLPGYAAVPSRFAPVLAEHGMTPLYADSGGSFHGCHPQHRFRNGDEFYHCSRHRFAYTHSGTGLHLGITQDGTGWHSRLLEDCCTCGPVPAGDGVCP